MRPPPARMVALATMHAGGSGGRRRYAGVDVDDHRLNFGEVGPLIAPISIVDPTLTVLRTR